MITIAEKNAPTIEDVANYTPSKRQLLKATAVALAIAAAIFFTAVLPAEYGIDPLHTGAALGLMNLAKSGGTPAAPASRSLSRPASGSRDSAPAGAAPAASAEDSAPVITGVFVAQPSGFKVDSRELKLGPGEGMEIKYHMQQNAGMVYSWTASKKVQYEFHGEPDVKPAGAPEDYFESYEKDDKVGVDQYHGTFTAPSTGIQGWFWDNESAGPITIKLVTAGFYDYILQNKDDVKTRLQPRDPQ
jgi:hypothetical protein